VYNMLGAHYLTVAERLGVKAKLTRLPETEARRLASVLWVGDPRLSTLLSEWTKGQHAGLLEQEFQRHIWTLGWDAFEHALHAKGTRALPTLFYRRGTLLLDRSELQGARKEFLDALDENSRSTVAGVREQVLCQSALGSIAWKEEDYREALRWYRLAEDAQTRSDGNWVTDLSANRQRMEATIAMLPGSGASAEAADDPEVCYSLGVRYLDAADLLGVTPRGTPLPEDKAKRLANDVWPDDPRLPTLLLEWAGGRHGGLVEKAFQDYLRTLAWDAFERGLRSKGDRVMPSLYFRRGMTLGERGDLQGARKEFLAALDEASRDTDAEAQQEVTVVSHDALGAIAWTAKDFPEALRWFRVAEEEQTRFGGRWVSDITEKRQRLEGIVASLPGH
jgi:tetratricopeptide (TPR) repeat protein